MPADAVAADLVMGTPAAHLASMLGIVSLAGSMIALLALIPVARDALVLRNPEPGVEDFHDLRTRS